MTPIDVFSIREAISSDATAIWQLNCDEMGYQYSLADTRQNIIKLLSSNSNRIYVAVYNVLNIQFILTNL